MSIATSLKSIKLLKAFGVRDVKISYKERVIIAARSDEIALYKLDTFEFIKKYSMDDHGEVLSLEVEPNSDDFDSDVLYVGSRQPKSIIKINLTNLMETEILNVVEVFHPPSNPYFLKLAHPSELAICEDWNNNKKDNMLIVGMTGWMHHALQVLQTNPLTNTVLKYNYTMKFEADNHHGVMGVDVNDKGEIVMHTYSKSNLIWLKKGMKTREEKYSSGSSYGRGIVIDPKSQNIFVSLTEDNKIGEFDSDGNLLSEHPSFPRPSGLCFNRENGQLLVACQSSGINICELVK